MSSSAGDPKPPVTGYPVPPAGAAYPYHAPPPQSFFPSGTPPPPQPYHAYYPPPYPSAASSAPPPRHNAALLRRLISIAVALFLVFGLAVLIIWLVLRPRLPDFSISSAAVSNFNASGSQLSADFDLNLTVRNANTKMAIYYDQVTAFVFYGTEHISQTSLAPFYQVKRNTTSIRASLAAVGVYVDSDAVNGINSGRSQSDGAVGFNFRIVAWVRFKSGIWKSRWHFLRVYCDDVAIGLKNGTNSAAAGHLVRPSADCKSNL